MVDLIEKWRPAALKSAHDHLNSSVGAGIHDLMSNALSPGKAGIDRSSISAEHRLGVDQRHQHLAYMSSIGLGQFEVSGIALPVAHHHHWNLVVTRAAGHADPAAFTRRPR